jgi:hypothetical protein
MALSFSANRRVARAPRAGSAGVVACLVDNAEPCSNQVTIAFSDPAVEAIRRGRLRYQHAALLWVRPFVLKGMKESAK